MVKATRSILRRAPWIAAAGVLGVALFAGPSSAIQTGASFSVIPSESGPFTANGQTFTVEVRANNSSSNTPHVPPPPPAIGTDPVPATITGPIVVDFGCTDCQCQLADNFLGFVPGAVTGCETKNAGVTSCAPAGANSVSINLAVAGITIPAGGSVSIATLKFVVQNINPANPPAAPRVIRAFTGPCSVTACTVIGGQPDATDCVACDAEGCTQVRFRGTTDLNCPHDCPNKIICGEGANFDTFQFHAVPATPPGFDPNAFIFSVNFTKGLPPMALATMPTFPMTLPVGSFVNQGDAFTFNDPNAKDNGGIFRIKAAERDGLPPAHRVDIVGYSKSLCTALNSSMFAVDSTQIMTFDFNIGGVPVNPGPLLWTRTPYGWFRRNLTPP